jgi:uncharacterized protein (TIGR03067 family)
MEERVMRRLIVIVAFSMVVGPACADDGSEMKKFAGAWKVKDGSADGMPIPDDAKKVARLVFDGDRFAFKGGPSEPVTTFRIDAASQTIEIAPPKGETKTLRGRYKFDKGMLTLCLTDREKLPETLLGGKDRMVLVLERDR